MLPDPEALETQVGSVRQNAAEAASAVADKRAEAATRAREVSAARERHSAAGREDEAWLVEHAAMQDQRVTRLGEADAVTPYFSILLIHGQGRRP